MSIWVSVSLLFFDRLLYWVLLGLQVSGSGLSVGLGFRVKDLCIYKGWIDHASRGFFMHRTASTCGNQDSSQSVCFIVSSKLAVRPASSWRMPSIPVKAAKSFSSNFLDRVLARSSVYMGNAWF